MFFFGEKGEKENTVAKRIQSKFCYSQSLNFYFLSKSKPKKKQIFMDKEP